jgi:HSP20 family molecular chaperone IbpA
MTDKTAGLSTGGERTAQGTRDIPVFSPTTDIHETEDALIMTVEMPGVETGGVNVTLEKRELTIAGHCRPFSPEGYALTHAEYRDGDFERSFTLSDAIDGGAIKASMKDGVLTLTLPKAKPEPSKTINVAVG